MRAVVLAGGMGTRLRAKVPDLPKVMVSVGGRPFLEYVLDRLVVGGCREVILSVGYKAKIVMDHFGRRYKSASLDYAVEKQPLGTGGAALYALQNVGDEPALVLNGDTLLNVDYRAFIDWYMKMPAQVAMVLREVPDITRYGAVLTTQGIVVGFAEKGKTGPGLISAGVYILQYSVFKSLGLSGSFSLETDLFQRFCGILRPRAYLTNAYFIDIGIPEDLDRARHEFQGMDTKLCR